MSDREYKPDIALTYKQCPVCGERMEGDILLGKRLGTTKVHDAFHDKIVEISPTMCEKCAEQIKDMDAVYLVEYDPEKTEQKEMERLNPWRTGKVIAMARSGFERNFDIPFPPHRWIYTQSPIVTDLMAIALAQSREGESDPELS